MVLYSYNLEVINYQFSIQGPTLSQSNVPQAYVVPIKC